MKKLAKRFGTVLTAVLLCFSLTLSVSAKGIDSTDGVASTYSSISGYAAATLTGPSGGYSIYVTASGWGGLGVTITNSSSSEGYCKATLQEVSTGRYMFVNDTVPLNGTIYWSHLLHMGSSEYILTFDDYPSDVSFFSQCWLYG